MTLIKSSLESLSITRDILRKPKQIDMITKTESRLAKRKETVEKKPILKPSFRETINRRRTT